MSLGYAALALSSRGTVAQKQKINPVTKKSNKGSREVAFSEIESRVSYFA